MPRSIRNWLSEQFGGDANVQIAKAIGSAIGGPLAGWGAGRFMENRNRNNQGRHYAADSPLAMGQTPQNNIGLALGMTDWSTGQPGQSSYGDYSGQSYSSQPSNAFQGSQAGAAGDQQNSFVINQDGSYAVPDYMGSAQQPLMSPRNYGNGASQGGGIGFGWQSAQSPFDQGMLMDSLGFTGTTGTGPEDQAAMWLRKLVK